MASWCAVARAACASTFAAWLRSTVDFYRHARSTASVSQKAATVRSTSLKLSSAARRPAWPITSELHREAEAARKPRDLRSGRRALGHRARLHTSDSRDYRTLRKGLRL